MGLARPRGERQCQENGRKSLFRQGLLETINNSDNSDFEEDPPPLPPPIKRYSKTLYIYNYKSKFIHVISSFFRVNRSPVSYIGTGIGPPSETMGTARLRLELCENKYWSLPCRRSGRNGSPCCQLSGRFWEILLLLVILL